MDIAFLVIWFFEFWYILRYFFFLRREFNRVFISLIIMFLFLIKFDILVLLVDSELILEIIRFL